MPRPYLKTFLVSLLAALACSAYAQVSVSAVHYNETAEGSPLQNFTVRVRVQPPGGTPYETTRTCNGDCTFENLPTGSTLVFSAEKTDQPRDSVHTYDLVLISKHWMGLDTFKIPDHPIAADADCNGIVNNWDIVVLRKLILRIDTTFCYPWLLLNDQALLPTNPLGSPFPLEITVKNYDGRPLALRFRAVKIGNVNSYPPPEKHVPQTLANGFLSGPLPNPTGNASYFVVQLDAPATVKLELFDAGGRPMYAAQIPGQSGAQQIELPAESMPVSGVYFWRIYTSVLHKSGKIVRQ